MSTDLCESAVLERCEDVVESLQARRGSVMEISCGVRAGKGRVDLKENGEQRAGKLQGDI